MDEILLDDDSTFTPAPARFTASVYQQAIFNEIARGTGDIMVNAVAGSGKTTTLVEASKLLPPKARSIFCAFNAHIVKELTRRLDGMECKTIHSIGLSTIAKHLGKQPVVDGNKYRALVRVESWKLADRMPTLNRSDLTSTLSELVDYCHTTLAVKCKAMGGTLENALEALWSVVEHFGVTLPCPLEEIASSVISVLSQGILQAKDERIISFSDMLWLPWVWGLKPATYDWVFVDECQDLNRAQLEMVLKLRAKRRESRGDSMGPYVIDVPTGRMIFVGDPRQAIYGFAGADAGSYGNIKQRTGATELPLSVSYRCPVLVVREAQEIVPAIEPRQGAPLGTVKWIHEADLYNVIREDDLILCRMTAPLISTCLDLIRMKVPARVRGKDIGRMLVKTIRAVGNLKGFTFPSFNSFLREYTKAQVERLSYDAERNEAQIERLYDLEAALAACYDGLSSAGFDDFCGDVQALFSDDKPGVWLSTVHKAKGLEAQRVFILRPDKLPLTWRGQQAWESEQEWNLRYVAVTRSLDELVYVRPAEASL